MREIDIKMFKLSLGCLKCKSKKQYCFVLKIQEFERLNGCLCDMAKQQLEFSCIKYIMKIS